MTGKFHCISLKILIIIIAFHSFCTKVCANELAIPTDRTQLTSWFNQKITRSSSSSPRSSLDQALVEAEAHAKVIKVSPNGKGDYTTINNALKSIPIGNKHRVIIMISPGTYKEKIWIYGNKPFITLYGEDMKNAPTIVFDGTAYQHGTLDSATLIVESDYFVAVNLNIVNSAPRPDGKRVGAQAVALRISGDKAAFYSCKFHGFQDTLCDDKGKHFFKNCYIEGTVDFIFGSGKSIYLNTELHVISGDREAMITAQARHTPQHDVGYAFVHCRVTGTGGKAYLGRSWMPYSRVVFAYSDLNEAVIPQGWSSNNQKNYETTAYFAEYKNKGSGSDLSKRVSFTKKLSDSEAQPFITLNFIDAAKWLVPPPKV